ncbi:hypothetical protein, partial [Nonomuraea deserti]|uniref:hypothetical protein n=1 Tax=Nonomuraea deserti TaxID=1848322 RepID=UPI001C70200C
PHPHPDHNPDRHGDAHPDHYQADANGHPAAHRGTLVNAYGKRLTCVNPCYARQLPGTVCIE